MRKLKTFLNQLWNDESGQGATEYILLIAIVIGIVLVFKDKIKGLIGGKLDEIGGGFGKVGVD